LAGSNYSRITTWKGIGKLTVSSGCPMKNCNKVRIVLGPENRNLNGAQGQDGIMQTKWKNKRH
jgi:hypothetical protein